MFGGSVYAEMKGGWASAGMGSVSLVRAHTFTQGQVCGKHRKQMNSKKGSETRRPGSNHIYCCNLGQVINLPKPQFRHPSHLGITAVPTSSVAVGIYEAVNGRCSVLPEKGLTQCQQVGF